MLGIGALLGIALLALLVIAVIGIAWHWLACLGIVMRCLALPCFALFGAVALHDLALVSVALLCIDLQYRCDASHCFPLSCLATPGSALRCLVLLGTAWTHLALH